MAWLEEFAGMASVGDRAERAWRLPLGAASPLWAAFGAVAGAGVAYWWMTRWTQAVNLEALNGLLAPRTAQTPVRIEIIAEPAPAAPEPAPVLDAESEPQAQVAPEPAPVAIKAAELDLAPEPPAPASDDLTVMVGIGPKLADALAASGVTRFAQIAAWTKADLADMDAALNLKGRAIREAWVEQAKRLAKR
jgi:predicted flap endonuclease-1-like 5' DNA nuclease